jgi:hypothetical protein
MESFSIASRGVGNALDERSAGTVGVGVGAADAGTPHAGFFGAVEVAVPFLVTPFVTVGSVFGFVSARAILNKEKKT